MNQEYVSLVVKNRPPLSFDLTYPYEQGTVWVDTANGEIYDFVRVNTARQWVKRAATNIAADIHSAITKTTPVAADEFGFWDSISGLLRKCTWANIVSALGLSFGSKAKEHDRQHAINSALDHTGYGDSVTKNVGTVSGTVAAGDHTHAHNDNTALNTGDYQHLTVVQLAKLNNSDKTAIAMAIALG